MAEPPVLYLLPDDNELGGFGFGQGSTDGVVNRYQRRGFHRRGAEESNKKSRDALNLRDAKGAYKCHFDPEYDVRNHRHGKSRIHLKVKYSKKKSTKYWMIIFLLFSIVLAMMLWRKV
jgi:hypothetical protein